MPGRSLHLAWCPSRLAGAALPLKGPPAGQRGSAAPVLRRHPALLFALQGPQWAGAAPGRQVGTMACRRACYFCKVGKNWSIFIFSHGNVYAACLSARYSLITGLPSIFLLAMLATELAGTYHFLNRNTTGQVRGLYKECPVINPLGGLSRCFQAGEEWRQGIWKVVSLQRKDVHGTVCRFCTAHAARGSAASLLRSWSNELETVMISARGVFVRFKEF